MQMSMADWSNFHHANFNDKSYSFQTNSKVCMPDVFMKPTTSYEYKPYGKDSLFVEAELIDDMYVFARNILRFTIIQDSLQYIKTMPNHYNIYSFEALREFDNVTVMVCITFNSWKSKTDIEKSLREDKIGEELRYPEVTVTRLEEHLTNQ